MCLKGGWWVGQVWEALFSGDEWRQGKENS